MLIIHGWKHFTNMLIIYCNIYIYIETSNSLVQLLVTCRTCIIFIIVLNNYFNEYLSFPWQLLLRICHEWHIIVKIFMWASQAFIWYAIYAYVSCEAICVTYRSALQTSKLYIYQYFGHKYRWPWQITRTLTPDVIGTIHNVSGIIENLTNDPKIVKIGQAVG